MTWQQLEINTDPAHIEQLEAWLNTFGALSLTRADAADQPLYEPAPETIPVWDQMILTALFNENCDIEQITTMLKNQLSDCFQGTIKVSIIHDRDWEREWLKDFKPMRFGKRLWICPDKQSPPVEDAIILYLDPGLAFGTGTHPTTALCLEWLDQNLQPGESVVDYGCGSGILALSSLKLGCPHVVAVDNDPQALIATEQNALRNQLPLSQLTLSLPEEAPALQVDVVLANILANPLVTLAQTLTALCKTNGRLVLSGILETQVDDVKKAYQNDFSFPICLQKQEWICLVGKKKTQLEQ